MAKPEQGGRTQRGTGAAAAERGAASGARGKGARLSKSDAMARQVQEALRPGQSVELLKELHILTREGGLNQDSRRKLKQVYHLFGFIEKILLQLESSGRTDITLADHGAGKSYLGFIIYDLFFRQREAGTIYGIETRQELVEKSRELAERLGFARMRFLPLTERRIAGADRRGDGAACLRYRHRRCDCLRPAEAGAPHGAGAVLPG